MISRRVLGRALYRALYGDTMSTDTQIDPQHDNLDNPSPEEIPTEIETPLVRAQKATALADAARHECERLCSAAIDELLTQHGCVLKISCVTIDGQTTHRPYVSMV